MYLALKRAIFWRSMQCWRLGIHLAGTFPGGAYVRLDMAFPQIKVIVCMHENITNI